MSLSNLPQPVHWFLRAAEAFDVAVLQGTLDADAVLIEDGKAYPADAIPAWFERSFRCRTRAVRPINETRRDGEVVVTVLVDEQDRGGRVAQVQHRWRFELKADRIHIVRLEPAAVPALPPVVAAYVQATNNFNLDGLLATFVDDALVNDQLRDHWGKAAIRDWAAREIVGPRMTMCIVDAIEQYGHVVVSAHIDGDLDWRGLPDPLALTFYFSVSGGRIVQLIILRNQSGT